MTTTREASRPLDEAPKDHTMIWLLVDYSSDGANPLENEILGWTIGHNGFDDTGVDEWEFAGWSWEQDCFTQGVGKVVGWHPLQRPDQQLATEPQGYVAGLEDLLRWNVQGGALVSHDEGRLVLYADIVHALSAHPDQPAADTPALNDELATMISDLSHTGKLSMLYRMEIADRITDLLAITATPAPSDKIAEAARDVFYIDCEFDGHNGPLLSIAMVRQDGFSLHVKVDIEAHDPWVIENVMPIMGEHQADDFYTVEPHYVGHVLRKFIGDCRAPTIIADSPVDIGRFCQSISTGVDGGWASVDYAEIKFIVRNVDCYPTSLECAVQHNAWWDAMALRALAGKGE